MYAFQLIYNKEHKSFKESNEGYTYVNLKRLSQISTKIRRFLYTAETSVEITKDDPLTKEFEAKINSKAKLFQNEHDDTKQKFIDFDTLLGFYMEEY